MIHLCTAFYNTRGGADRLIKSVRGQTLDDWRWHVSVDPTMPDPEGLAAIQAAAKTDPRIDLKIQEASTAPIIGAAKDDAAKMLPDGEGWSAWLDSDDWLDIEALETIARYTADTKAAWMISRVYDEPSRYAGPRMVHPRMDWDMLWRGGFGSGLPHLEAFRIERLREEPYDRLIALGEDWDIHLRFWKRWGPPVFIPKALYHWRTGLSQYDPVRARAAMIRIRAKHVPGPQT